MLIPYLSLKKYLDFDQDAHQLSDTLTMLGLEVDAIHTLRPAFSGVVIAQIKTVKAHPESSTLSIVELTDEKDSYTVVTSATNCKEGLLVPFARPGSQVGDIEFATKEIAGVASQGALLSLKEMSLGDDHSGIWILDQADVGTDLAALFTQEVLEISLTPNLGHCQSVYGVAREIAAAFNLKVRSLDAVQTQHKLPFSIHIDHPQDCSCYGGMILDGISITPSSLEVVRTLFGFGQTTINNVVDATNLVMLELGLPMHAFDRSLITGDTITVKRGSQEFTTLDQQTHTLDENDLIIADQKGAIALAGIMGGQHSKVSSQTSQLFVEGAIFDPILVRKTSRRLALRTEASARFEKGCDPFLPEKAFALFLSYLQVAQDQIPIEIYRPQSPEKHSIVLRTHRVNEILGSHLMQDQIATLLERLEFATSMQEEDLAVTVPSYRLDVRVEIDLIEEVGRLYGYDHLPQRSSHLPMTDDLTHPSFAFQSSIRKLFLRSGLQEALTPTLIDENLLKTIGQSPEDDSIISLKNAKGKQFSILRPSLMPGLQQAIDLNFARGFKEVSLFEVGKVHMKKESHFYDPVMITMALGEKKQKKQSIDFFTLKGKLEGIFALLGVEPRWTASKIAAFHPHMQAAIHIGEIQIGQIGVLHPTLTKDFSCFAEISLDDLRGTLEKKPITIPSVYPSTSRDITIPLGTSQTYQSILDRIAQEKVDYLESVEFIDLYQPDPSAQPNLTLRFVFRKQDTTILFEEAQSSHEKLCAILQNDLA